jgi:hypothetical protein
MQSLEVPSQVVNMTWFINNIKEEFEFEFELELKPSYIAGYTVKVLQNTVAAIVTLGVSHLT